jgi:hypothetical protein
MQEVRRDPWTGVSCEEEHEQAQQRLTSASATSFTLGASFNSFPSHTFHTCEVQALRPQLPAT